MNLVRTKKMLLVLTCCLAICLAVVLTGCGGSSKSSEPVKSTNGYVSVTEYNENGLKTFIDTKTEMVTFAKPHLSNNDQPSSDKMICFVTVDKSGDIWFIDEPEGITIFTAGQPYTKDMLSADLTAYQAKYPNILEDLEEVTIGEYTYYASHMTVNGEDGIQYVSVVDDKPVAITIVGADLLNDEGVKKCIESVKWNFS